jgi:hypothetical protein
MRNSSAVNEASKKIPLRVTIPVTTLVIMALTHVADC